MAYVPDIATDLPLLFFDMDIGSSCKLFLSVFFGNFLIGGIAD